MALDGRANWMKVLAEAPTEMLGDLWKSLGIDEAADAVRGPETGLVTLRGRIGGGGQAFNLGEATVTRMTVRLAGGEIGHAYTLGRDAEKTRICAMVDALWQREPVRERLRSAMIEPLATHRADRDAKARAEAAATKVDFFTLVRGED